MPGLAARLKSAGLVIKAIAGIVAILPSIAILVGLVDIPRDIGALVRFISVSVSVCIIMAVILVSAKIRKISSSVFAVAILILISSAAILSFCYVSFSHSHLIVSNDDGIVERHVVPLNPSHEIQSIVDPFAGEYLDALETSVQRERLKALMDRESSSALALIVILLVLAQSCIVLAIMLGAWKLTERRMR